MCNDVVYIIDDSELVCLTHHKLIEKVYDQSVIKKFSKPEKALIELMKDLGKNLEILLFLDIKMPFMTGLEVVHLIENSGLSSCGKLSVIYVSSTIDEFLIEQGENRKMVKGAIQKPLTYNKLERFVRGHYENITMEVVA